MFVACDFGSLAEHLVLEHKLLHTSLDYHAPFCHDDVIQSVLGRPARAGLDSLCGTSERAVLCSNLEAGLPMLHAI